MISQNRLANTALATLLVLPAVTTLPAAGIAAVDELIVTVRKREETILDVPVAISAFTAGDFSRRAMQELEDIAQQTPGFNFEDGANGGLGLPTIRGASQFTSTVLETNVSVFIDGLYVPRQYAFDMGLMDTARIEIAKGPQSALYGRNAFMGALNYIPNKAPLDELDVEAEITFGSDEREDYSISVGVPIVEGKFGVRASWAQSEFDGTWGNSHPEANNIGSPSTKGNLGGWDDESWSIGAVIKPTEAFEFDIAYYDIENFNEKKARYRIDRRFNGSADELNCGNVIPGSPGFPPFVPPSPDLHMLWCGELPTMEERSTLQDPRGYGVVTESEILRLGAKWDITDAITLEYIFGNIQTEAHTTAVSAATDPLTEDGNAFLFGGNTSFSTPNGGFDYDSHEFRVNYDEGGNWSGMLGAYYSEGADTDFQVFGTYPLYNAPGGTDPVPYHDVVTNAADLSRYTTTETDVWALFGLFEYNGFFDGRGGLTVEARYTHEEKSQFNHLVDPVALPIAAEIQLLEDSYNYFTPRITFDYDVTDNNMVYASISKGVLSGGFNGTPSRFLSNGFLLLEDERFFDTSSNWTYEIGSKNTFLDGRAQLSTAIYHVDWEDMHMARRPTIVPALDALLSSRDRDRITTIVENLGDVEVYGIEVEGSIQLTDNLTVNAGASYQDSTYKDGTISDRIFQSGACDDVVCASNGDVGGNTLQRQSPTQVFGGVMWEDDLAIGNMSDLGYYIRTDVTYQEKQYTSEINTAWIQPRTLVNMSAGLTAEHWELQFWAKNLFDEVYNNQAGNVFRVIDVGYTPTLGHQRTIGGTLKVKF